LIVYPDSSVLASAYLRDIHSLEVARRLALRPNVLLTPFHRAEVVNAIFQQVFRGRLSEMEAQLAFINFDADRDAGVWLFANLPEKAFPVCVELAQKHVPALGAKTLDTLHVAAALELKADSFWTFDARQAEMARAAGLTVS
jgi:predicted nucleic acid-binding protein